ncbi:hypothetical protein BU16DRAFT_545382 [Lophium mytilinum]|uniref:Uncharacterized protein n=1 Tax=Lophium mytilinum TaxID=390894 RepID=A0A6A6Q7E7_9PEZI|nr:hypothetical protein BU16DRAFT_545382 [Lophium mytilinum]
MRNCLRENPKKRQLQGSLPNSLKPAVDIEAPATSSENMTVPTERTTGRAKKAAARQEPPIPLLNIVPLANILARAAAEDSAPLPLQVGTGGGSCGGSNLRGEGMTAHEIRQMKNARLLNQKNHAVLPRLLSLGEQQALARYNAKDEDEAEDNVATLERQREARLALDPLKPRATPTPSFRPGQNDTAYISSIYRELIFGERRVQDDLAVASKSAIPDFGGSSSSTPKVANSAIPTTDQDQELPRENELPDPEDVLSAAERIERNEHYTPCGRLGDEDGSLGWNFERDWTIGNYLEDASFISYTFVNLLHQDGKPARPARPTPASAHPTDTGNIFDPTLIPVINVGHVDPSFYGDGIVVDSKGIIMGCWKWEESGEDLYVWCDDCKSKGVHDHWYQPRCYYTCPHFNELEDATKERERFRMVSRHHGLQMPFGCKMSKDVARRFGVIYDHAKAVNASKKGKMAMTKIDLQTQALAPLRKYGNQPVPYQATGSGSTQEPQMEDIFVKVPKDLNTLMRTDLVEEQRVNFDYLLESIKHLQKLLVPIEEALNDMPIQDRPKFRMPPHLGHRSSSVPMIGLRRLFTKVTGDSIWAELYARPHVAVPTLVELLREKLASVQQKKAERKGEWHIAERQLRELMNKWREYHNRQLAASLAAIGESGASTNDNVLAIEDPSDQAVESQDIGAINTVATNDGNEVEEVDTPAIEGTAKELDEEATELPTRFENTSGPGEPHDMEVDTVGTGTTPTGISLEPQPIFNFARDTKKSRGLLASRVTVATAGSGMKSSKTSTGKTANSKVLGNHVVKQKLAPSRMGLRSLAKAAHAATVEDRNAVGENVSEPAASEEETGAAAVTLAESEDAVGTETDRDDRPDTDTGSARPTLIVVLKIGHSTVAQQLLRLATDSAVNVDSPRIEGRVLRKRKRHPLDEGEDNESSINSESIHGGHANDGVNALSENGGQGSTGVKVNAFKEKAPPRKKAKTSAQSAGPAPGMVNPVLAQQGTTQNASEVPRDNAQLDMNEEGDTAEDDKEWEIITPGEGRYKINEERSMTLQRRHKISGTVQSITYTHADDVDWALNMWITRLNAWRRQCIRRFGGEHVAGYDRQKWSKEDIAWVRDAIAKQFDRREKAGENVKKSPPWAEIYMAFVVAHPGTHRTQRALSCMAMRQIMPELVLAKKNKHEGEGQADTAEGDIDSDEGESDDAEDEAEVGDIAPNNNARTTPFVAVRREGDRVKLRLTGLRSLANSDKVERRNGERSSSRVQMQLIVANARNGPVGGKKRKIANRDDEYISPARSSKRIKTASAKADDDEVMEDGGVGANAHENEEVEEEL